MGNRKWFMCLAVVSAAVVLCLAGALGAQEAVAPGSSTPAVPAAVQSSPVKAANTAPDEQTDLSLEELLNVEVTVASGKAETVFSTPSTVTVITQEMIQQYNIKSVAEALTFVPGFAVYRTYLKRDIPTARGILEEHYANKVLVLINGISTWNAVTGEANIDRVNINDVDHIEVLKGPASVLYGTNAFTGAVNLVLKNPSREGSGLHLSAGDRYAFGGGGHYSYTRNDFSLFVAANSSDERGSDFLFSDETAPKAKTGHVRDYLTGSNFTVFSAFKDHSLLFNGTISHEGSLGASPLFSSGAGKDQVTEGYLIGYQFAPTLMKKIKMSTGVNYDWNQRNISRTANDSLRTNVKGYRANGFVKASMPIGAMLNVELGSDCDYRESVEYKNVIILEDSVTTENKMSHRGVTELSIYEQVGVKKYSFDVLLGSRYTRNKLFGSNISFRGTVVYTLNSRNSIKAIVGQSYRAPSAFELYFDPSPQERTVFGNPDLKPEKCNSYELAYLASFGNVFVQALGYRDVYFDKIYRVVGTVIKQGVTYSNVNIYANGNAFHSTGAELEVKYRNPKLIDGFLNYSVIDGDNGDEVAGNGHYNFKYVPKHTLSGGLHKAYKNFFVSVTGHYVSKTFGPVGMIAPAKTGDIDVGLTQQVSSTTVTHCLSVKNIMDRDFLIPEYVRKSRINALPDGYKRRIEYSLRVNF